ncbi:MAG: lysophospholipid acyltransferase family protein [Corynebacterium sp.]|nr:lysophospholipid acyltransferase family protein [Corynebacterium sp.]
MKQRTGKIVEKNRWYTVFKTVVFGPVLRVWNRPWTEGMNNIPSSGSAIVASNHQAVMDSFYFPLMCPRQITFLAKSEYFTAPGLVGAVQRWFFTVLGQVPVERTSASAAEDMLSAAKKVLGQGKIIGIYPEGTRSPDGRVYKGRTGMARLALETGVDVIPVAMIGTRKANPIGTWIPRPHRVGMRVGVPINACTWAKDAGLDPQTHESARAFTDYFMRLLAEMANQPYVDVYGSEVKESLNAGNGYPPGAELR